jgi:CRISPR-associated protein Csx17
MAPMAAYLDHELAGCAPVPLAAYLKALGVLRVLGSQADPGARGAWRADTFVLTTRLDRPALLEFFSLGQFLPLDGYVVTSSPPRK